MIMITHLPRILSRLIVDDEDEEDDGRTASTSAETITATTAAAAFSPIIKCSCSSAADSNSLSSNINDEEEEGKNAIGNHSKKATSQNEEEGEETPMLVTSKGESRRRQMRRSSNLVGNKEEASNLEWKRPNCDINRRRRREKNILERRSILFAILLLTLFPLLGPTLSPWANVEAIRCYCTDEHCVPYGVCEANACLVGLLKASNAVIRTCGNQALGCQRNVDRWSHLCSCEENFCNTFLFLKASTSIDGPRSRVAPESGGSGSSNFIATGDHRIFERIEQPGGAEFATFDHQNADDEPAPIKNSNLLTLLLVIVPLSVGATAVVVVAINYYCHLC